MTNADTPSTQPVVKKRRFKWTKRIISVLVIIPFLLFLAFAGAVSLIDFNQYKPQIEKEVSELTNREFKIDGEIEVSVLPFMLNVGEMSLKNPQGFESENLLTMKESQIELSLRTLFLEKELRIVSLELIEPQLFFIQKQDNNNWDDMPIFAALFPADQLEEMAQRRFANIQPQDQQLLNKYVASGNQTQSQSTVNIATLQEKWLLQSLVIKNAELSYYHQVQDFTVSLKQANLLAFDVIPHEPFQIKSDFVYQHSQSPRTFDFEINGRFLLSNHYSQLHLSNWNGVFRLRLPPERNLPDIRLTTSGKNLMVDFKHQQLYVNEVQLKGLDAEVMMSFQGEFGVDPLYQGEFSANSINVSNWIEHLGLPKPQGLPKGALTNTGGKFNWRWDGWDLQLEKIDATLDESRITGELHLPIYSDKNLTFDLAIADFNTQKYSLGESNLNADNQLDIESVILGSAVRVLEEYNSVGKLQLSNIQFAGIQTDNVRIEVYSENKNISLAPFDILFTQGQLTSKLNLDLSLSIPQLSWQGQTDNLDLQQLYSESPQLAGLLNSHFYLYSFGKTQADWLENLSGTLNANLESARIYGLDVNQLLSGEMLLNATKPSFTYFDQLKIHGKFVKGVYTPKRVLAQSERFSALGFGKVDLPNQSVSGLLEVTIEKPSAALKNLQGVRIPVHYSGSLTAASWSVNLAQLSPKLFKQR